MKNVYETKIPAFHPISVVIIGGAPAGLTAAYELVKLGIKPVVLEKGDKVGGLSRTETYKGFHFDLGGHRFFTKSPEVKAMWAEVLGDDFIRRPRLSRIYYNNKFFNYPLKPQNVLLNLGIVESIRIVLSYLRWQVFPYKEEETFEQWVTNRFGKRLFQTFFKSYTEKVWGIPCTELKAEWAAQRIKDLSLRTALLNMFITPKQTIKTLIEEFQYPRLGPGMMWTAVKDLVERNGGTVYLNTNVVKIHRVGNVIDSVIISANGDRRTIEASHFISSMPITEFIKKLDPAAPASVLTAAEKLHYRDFLTVCLIVNKPDLFPDNWIYIHDPKVKVGRIQNFKNWSHEMVPDLSKTSLGLEYFCNVGEDLWNMADADLIELGKLEVARIGIARYADIEDGCVVRVQNAYPVYDSDYRGHLRTVRTFVDGLENFMTIGRNGLHRYNNQDHAMLTGMMAVRNLIGEKNDLWSVNTDQEYHEEIARETAAVSEEVAELVEQSLTLIFRKLDGVAFGLSLGTVAGLLFFLATLFLVLKGGDVVGPTLQLLGQYFPGYHVTPGGSVLVLVYGFIVGFVGGWFFALLKNLLMLISMIVIHRRLERQSLWDIIEYI